MNENKLLEQLKEASKDGQFMEGLYVSADHKEFVGKLASKGIEVSDEEAKQLFEGMKSEANELGEDELDDVAGGVAIPATCWLIAGGAVFLGACYKKYKQKRK